MSGNLPPINPGGGEERKLNPQNMRTHLQHQHTSPSPSLFIGHQHQILHDLRGLEMSSYHDEGVVEGYAPPRMMTNESNGNSSGIYTTDAYNHHVVVGRVVSNEVNGARLKVDQQHQLNHLQQFNQAIVVDNNKNNHRIVISSGNEGHVQPSIKIGHVESKQENGKYTFHNTIVNQEKKKRKKREVLEGCNHFKIDSIGNRKDEDFIVENQVLKKRKSEKLKQVQVSNFEVLPTTDNNAMFGVFKKKPTQQSYEAVWSINQSNNDPQSVKATSKQVSEQQPQHSNTQHNETQIRMTSSPNHYPSSNSSSTNISQQATLPNYSNNNTYLLNGFNTLDHNQPANFTQVGIIQHSTSSNEITTLVDVSATIGPSSSQPKRDLSNLNYGTITRSAHFQSATDMLFSEKQNEEPTEEGKLSNNCNDYSKQATIPSSSVNENRNNLTESSTSYRTTMPSIKELFK